MPQVNSKAILLIRTSISLMHKRSQTYEPIFKHSKNSSDILINSFQCIPLNSANPPHFNIFNHSQFLIPTTSSTSENWGSSSKHLYTCKIDTILTITNRITYHQIKVNINRWPWWILQHLPILLDHQYWYQCQLFITKYLTIKGWNDKHQNSTFGSLSYIF